MDKDILKMTILDALSSKVKGTIEEGIAAQKKRAALLPSFETEEEALKYAQRVASLQPGDLIKVINPNDDGLHPAVFVGEDDGIGVVFLIYDSEDKRLATGKTVWHAVVVD